MKFFDINKSNSTLFYLIQIFKAISKRSQKNILFVQILMLLSGILETLYIASLYSVMTSFSDQNNVISNFLIKLNLFSKENNLLIASIFFFVIISSLSSFSKILSTYFNLKMIENVGNEIGTICYKNTIHDSFEKQIIKEKNKTINTLTVQVNKVVTVMTNVFTLLLSSYQIIFTLIALIYIDFTIAISLFLILITLYLIITSSIKNKLSKYSKVQLQIKDLQFRHIEESIESIKNIILNNSYSYYIKSYKKIDRQIRHASVMTVFFGLFTRYLLEGVLILVLSSILLVMILSKLNIYNSIAFIGTFILSMQKILPSFNQVYKSIVNIRSRKDSIINVLNILSQKVSEKKSPKKFIMKKFIELKNINFKYINSDKYILKDFNLKIYKGERIAIIGRSGSGKSTLINLIMGLLRPTSGEILVDNQNINNENLINSWRANISQVPQKIYLLNSSVAKNISFDSEKDYPDKENIKKAAKQANIFSSNLDEFNLFKKNIGFDGSKLSGGEKQRISIARALYKNSQILVLDEATSSLDCETEESILKNLNNISRDVTIIAITHNLRDSSNFDRIIKI